MSIKVLVVDSTEQAERLAKETLVPLGCQIITATSSALGIFLARKNFPSLIINGIGKGQDVDLPREIHSDADLAHIPVVIVCASEVGHSASIAEKSGANKVLHLPLSPENFFEELRPYLHETQDHRPEETPE